MSGPDNQVPAPTGPITLIESAASPFLENYTVKGTQSDSEASNGPTPSRAVYDVAHMNWNEEALARKINETPDVLTDDFYDEQSTWILNTPSEYSRILQSKHKVKKRSSKTRTVAKDKNVAKYRTAAVADNNASRNKKARQIVRKGKPTKNSKKSFAKKKNRTITLRKKVKSKRRKDP